MPKFLITGLIFLTLAAGLTFYFRQRSSHRSGKWTIQPGCRNFYNPGTTPLTIAYDIEKLSG
jgi:hypothetical protein